ncbi:MAG: hypothetical protein JO337_07605 [Acidimicrobiales bacterium]|nr:hypothetical protein [Acidimicrobiales bacterium]
MSDHYVRGYLEGEARDLGPSSLIVYLAVGSILSRAALAGITADVGWAGVERAAIDADWGLRSDGGGGGQPCRLYGRLPGGGLEQGCDFSFVDALELVVTGFGPVSPRGGFSLDVEELTRRGLSRADAERRMRILGMLEYTVLAPPVLLAAIYMMAQGIKAQAGLLPSWVIGVPAGGLVTVALLVKWRRDGHPGSWSRPVRRWLDAIEDLLD